MNKTRMLQVCVDPKLGDKLDREAKAMGLGLSAYLRFLIATHPKRKS